MKKLAILLLTTLLSITTFGLNDTQDVDAYVLDDYPAGAETVTVSFTNLEVGAVISVLYPSQIFEGQDLPMRVRFDAVGSGIDNIDMFCTYWNGGSGPQTACNDIIPTPLTAVPLMTKMDYFYDASSLSAGTYNTAAGIYGFRYDYQGTTDVMNQFSTVYLPFEVIGNDVTSPVINGAELYYASVSDPKTLDDIKLTLTANDETDGNVTSSIINIVDNYTSNSTVLGDYTTTWQVSDAAGNTAQKDVVIRVMDIDDPLINLVGSSTITLEVFDTYTELGSTVTDNYDTGLTATISGTVNTSIVGTYYKYYNVSDSSGNAATQVTRIINVQDTTDPVINLSGSSVINIEVFGTYTELGASVTDNYDTGLTASISGSVNTSILCTYNVNYSVTDSSGNNVVVTRVVNIVDTTAPVITINLNPTEYIEFGNIYTEPGAIVSDNYDSGLTIEITGSVNPGVLGTYYIYYNAVDLSGNNAIEKVRTVIVQDSIAPTFGAGDQVVFNSQNVSIDTIMESISAYDVYGGDLTSSIVTSNDTYSGNETIVGIYSIRLTVSDDNGNETVMDLTIEVKDDIAPVFTGSSYLLTIAEADAMSQEQIVAWILNNQP